VVTVTLHLATVPSSLHTHRGPHHRLSRVRLGLEGGNGPQKLTGRWVSCGRAFQSTRQVRTPLSASTLDLATVPVSPHTQKGKTSTLSRVQLGLEGGNGPRKLTGRWVSVRANVRCTERERSDKQSKSCAARSGGGAGPSTKDTGPVAFAR